MSSAFLYLGLLRFAALEEKARQRKRARKTKAYIKMTRALKTDFYRLRCLSMDDTSFFKLLAMVRPIMQADDKDMEEIEVVELLLLTLKYLASGCSLEELTQGCDLSLTELVKDIPMTCKAIFKALKPYIKFPREEKEWLDIVNDFEKKWNFNHCAGAFSARHIAVNKPLEGSEVLLNHKGFHSVLLIAVVNANHEFVYVDIGTNGGYDQKLILSATGFFGNMIEETINLPKDCPLPASDVAMPYVFLSDAYYVIENMMRTYPLDNVSCEEKIFNYRFGRAYRVVDDAFGILYERFGVLQRNIDVENANDIVIACCALHNYLAKTINDDYLRKESLDVEDVVNYKFQKASWRLKEEGLNWDETHPLAAVPQGPEEILDGRGKGVRESFTNYFIYQGKVPFQEQMVNVVPELQLLTN
ncbi:uncharacterized protein LOC114354597 [Ostrinia furnacalis]|uniref:uncharacterized protein LOC114354597 n=1 Tax=Ostrinia furnacalis TaxID=93504 RepID=UPI00103EF4B0|nr:uncharacterized protein LOC114354597 [Ostrinia furnacalis]